ncbi:DNA polymerase kappa isoform X1 [Pelobates fuscus]|uniref:DNA polymerase kappa isoform X1 n=1 Tax=Pelobates fuscus TaxID=191477 RepID=UPI002FE4A15A
MDQKDDKDATLGNEAFQYRMGLNDNKAGMEGLDKEKINKIIMDVTKGSRFYDNELKKDQQVNQRIEKMMQQKARLTSQQIKKAQAQMDRLVLEFEKRRDLNRVIVHIDMDAFYAAVEMRDNPELKDKPMAVGSMSMLSTSNYLARRFGVRAAMPGFIAKKLCPNLTIVPTHFDQYRAVSSEIREILADYDPNFLPLSLDEAYLDITDHLEERLSWPEEKRRHVITDENVTEERTLEGAETGEQEQCPSPVLFEDSPSFPADQNSTVATPDNADKNQLVKTVIFGVSAEDAVEEMRFRIEQKTKLTASAGIAPNMLLAKVCSDKNKPNGQYTVPPDRQAVMDFIQDLPIRKVPGIGKVTEKMLKALGVVTCADLYQQRALLSLLFSETAWQNFLHIAMGLGSTHVEKDGERKSMSTERTFSEIHVAEEQFDLCQQLCKDLAQDLGKERLKGKTVTLKLKNVNFEVKTRACTVNSAVSTEEEIFSFAKEILKAEIDSVAPEPLRLRLMGVRVSGFLSEDDKGYHQKSIISFLCPSKSSSSTSGERPAKSNQEITASLPPRESFFNQKRAAREIQEHSPCKLNNREEKMPCVSSEDKRKEATLEEMGKNEDLTCPICFMKESSWDLEGLNKHIDICLSRTPVSSVIKKLDKDENSPFLRGKHNDGDDDYSLEDFQTVDVHTKNLVNKIVDRRTYSDLDKGVFNEIRALEELGEEVQMDYNHCALHDTNTKGYHQMPSKNILFKCESNFKEPVNETPSQPSTSVLLESPVFICPICNSKQDSTDLAAFNRHVDVCLNRGILKEMSVEIIDVKKESPLTNHKQTDHIRKGNRSNKATKQMKRSGVSNQNPMSKKPKSNCPTKTIDRFFK